MLPREMDLLTPDRKPDKVIRVGDYVKVKSKEWYEKWKDSRGCVGSFVPGMDAYCGKFFPVEIIYVDVGIRLGGGVICTWKPEFFEEVYPKEEYTWCKIGNDYAVIDSHLLYDTKTTARVNGGLFVNNVGKIVPTDAISVGTFCANGVTIPPNPQKPKQKIKLISKFKPIKLKKV